MPKALHDLFVLSFVLASVLGLASASALSADERGDQLLAATRKGDLAAVKRLLDGQTDLKAIFAGGTLLLPPRLEEGDYVLQVVVTDTASSAKTGAAVQSAAIAVKR